MLGYSKEEEIPRKLPCDKQVGLQSYLRGFSTVILAYFMNRRVPVQEYQERSSSR